MEKEVCGVFCLLYGWGGATRSEGEEEVVFEVGVVNKEALERRVVYNFFTKYLTKVFTSVIIEV